MLRCYRDFSEKNLERLLEGQSQQQDHTVLDKVQRACTVVDLIKQKEKLYTISLARSYTRRLSG